MKGALNIGWVGLEKLLVHGVSFVQGVILARLLCPEDFGLAAMLGIFLCIGNIMSESGLGTAYVVFGGDGRRLQRWNVGLALAVYALLAAGAPAIADFYAQPVLRPLVLVMGVGLVLDAASVIGQARLQRTLRFRALLAVNCLTALSGLLVSVLLAWRGFGVWAIAGMGVIASFVRLMLLEALTFRAVATEDKGRSMRELLAYGWKLTLSKFVSVAYDNAFQLVIGKLFSPMDVGLFARGRRWAALPADVANEGVMRVALPEFAKNVGAVRTYLLLNIVLLWPALAVLGLFAEPVVRLVLGEQWLPCVPYLRILLVGMVFTPVINIAITLIKASGESGLLLKMDAVKRPLSFGLLGLGVFGGVAGLCWAKVAGDFIEMVVDLYYGIKVLRRRVHPVDLVYCWCDSVPSDSHDRCRYVDNGELYYSIRSADRYLPWIRTIWVFANDGTKIPDWLSAHPKVRTVFHSEVIPKEVLPLHNSVSIEFWIHRMPGLAERFVYSNDDMFFNRPLEPEDFFDAHGRMICRYDFRPLRSRLSAWTGPVGQTWVRSRSFVPGTEAEDVPPHHAADAYLKSVIAAFESEFPEEFLRSGSFPERTPDQLERDVFQLYAMQKGSGVFRSVKRGVWRRVLERFGIRLFRPRVETVSALITDPDYPERIREYRPLFFSLNDCEAATDEDRRRLGEFLKERFR